MIFTVIAIIQNNYLNDLFAEKATLQ